MKINIGSMTGGIFKILVKVRNKNYSEKGSAYQ